MAWITLLRVQKFQLTLIQPSSLDSGEGGGVENLRGFGKMPLPHVLLLDPLEKELQRKADDVSP